MLEKLFGSRLRAKVIGWLFTHTDQRFFVRQITSLLKEDSANLSRELMRLSDLGILGTTREGHQKYYWANKKCPIFAEMHNLAIKTTGLCDVLKETLEQYRKHIYAAFIYGSFAQGKENLRSDVDVMIIGTAKYDEVFSALCRVQEKLDRDVNPTVFSTEEFQIKINEDNLFLKSIFKGEKIFIIGDDNELSRLVEKRVVNRVQNGTKRNPRSFRRSKKRFTGLQNTGVKS